MQEEEEIPVESRRKPLWKRLTNKYLLVSVFFVGWMLFFDRHSVSYLLKLRSQADRVQQDLNYYKHEIRETQRKLDELTSNDEKLEKFGRETYYMKRSDEDVFVFIEGEE